MYCGRPAEALDHIRPRSRGGTDAPENLVPACAVCNSAKGSSILTEWNAAKVLRAVAVEPKVYAELLRIRAEHAEQLSARAVAAAAARAVAAEQLREDIEATGRLVGLSDAVTAGILGVSLAVARKARTRDRFFPAPRARASESASGALLYDPAELAAWAANRPGPGTPSVKRGAQ